MYFMQSLSCVTLGVCRGAHPSTQAWKIILLVAAEVLSWVR